MPPKVLAQANMDLLWACLETLPAPDWDVVAAKMGITPGAARKRISRLRTYYAAQKKEGKAFVDGASAQTPTGPTKSKTGEKLAEEAEADENTELDENTEAEESEDDVV